MTQTRRTTILTTAALAATLTLAPLVTSNCVGNPLEGDWFQCEDAACTVLDDEGIRFTAQDRWGALDAPGGTYTAGEAYELEQPRGTYHFDGQSLTLTQDGGVEQISAGVRFEGELLVIQVQLHQQVCEPSLRKPGEPTPPPACHEEIREETVRLRRVAEAGAVPFAPTAAPTPMPTPGEDDRLVQPPAGEDGAATR